jgi:hypothetical protein
MCWTKKSEDTVLSMQEEEIQVNMHARLKKLLRGEELKWRQRAKEKDSKEVMVIPNTFT